MDRTRNQFFSRAAFARDQDGSARVFQAINKDQHVLNVFGGADDAAHFRAYALAQRTVFEDQTNFLGHALQNELHLFQAKWLGDVVVSAQFHGQDGIIDGTVTGDDGHFRARRLLFYGLEEFQSRHLCHAQVHEDHVGRLGFQAGHSGFRTLGFRADKAQRLSNLDAKSANALLVIHNQ